MKSCSIETIERNTSLAVGDMFKEDVILVHLPIAPTFDYFRLTILFLLFLLLVYPTLYYCRQAYCLVCGRKLVFFVERCAMCRFVEAHPPDPRIVAALEDKGRVLQGEFPEAYPGKVRFENCLGSCCRQSRSLCSVFCWCGNGDSKVAAGNEYDDNDDEKKAPEIVADKRSDREAWLDDIYNFEDPNPTSVRDKVPAKVLKMKEAMEQKEAPPIVDSYVDRQKILQKDIDQYVIYKAINHPFLPPQPVGIGRQNKSWKEEKVEEEPKKRIKELDKNQSRRASFRRMGVQLDSTSPELGATQCVEPRS